MNYETLIRAMKACFVNDGDCKTCPQTGSAQCVDMVGRAALEVIIQQNEKIRRLESTSLTTEDKRNALMKYCSDWHNCGRCPKAPPYCNFSTMNEAEVNDTYAYVFE